MISVCIPAYNNPTSLVRTLHSVLKQKNCSFEVIITDDTRSDAVYNSIQSTIKNHRVTYIRNDNLLGPVNNWNYSLSIARGSVKKLIHHDDWFDNEYSLSQISNPILNGDADVVFSACKAYGEIGLKFIHWLREDLDIILKNEPERLVFGNLIGGPSVTAISSRLDISYDPNYLWMSDVDFYIRLLRIDGLRFSLLSNPIICISTDLRTQITRSFEKDHQRGLIELFQLVDREFYNKSLSQNEQAYLLSTLTYHKKSRAFIDMIYYLIQGRLHTSRAMMNHIFQGVF